MDGKSDNANELSAQSKSQITWRRVYILRELVPIGASVTIRVMHLLQTAWLTDVDRKLVNATPT